MAFQPALDPSARRGRRGRAATGTQFRPAPPPTFGSAQFTAELQRVYDVSKSLTATPTTTPC